MFVTLILITLFALLIGSLGFMIFWIFPRKLELMREIGEEATNADVIALAKKRKYKSSTAGAYFESQLRGIGGKRPGSCVV